MLILPMLFGAFPPLKPENRILLRYALDGYGYILSAPGQDRRVRQEWASVVIKLQTHGQDKHPWGPSTPRHEALCHAINLCGAPLKDDIFWGGENVRLGVR